MSQYKRLRGEPANGSLKQLSCIWRSLITWITMVILELIHVPIPDFVEGLRELGTEPTRALPGLVRPNESRSICWRWIIQVSALSASDGRVLAHRGNDGPRRIRVRLRSGSLKNGYHI